MGDSEEKKDQIQQQLLLRDRGDEEETSQIPLTALNHVSRLCRSVNSVDFYTKVLGFVVLQRPPSPSFDGAWLFNYGVGIQLVQKKDGETADKLDPMDNHISFQCMDMNAMERKLKEMKIKYMKRTINEKEGPPIDQLFFNDPDGFMIEVCNRKNLELVPAGSKGHIKRPRNRHNPPREINSSDK